MGIDQSLPPDVSQTTDLHVEREAIRTAIKQYQDGAARLRRDARWGSIANTALIGGNRSFSSVVQFRQGCADLDRCNLAIADRMDEQAKKLQAYMDQTEHINAQHGDGLRQATA